MKKAVVILGPTAVGKTSLALKLAQKFDSTIISADSVQVFKGLDIISGKDKDKFLGRKVHLIDVISSSESFSVSQFEKLASEVLNSLEVGQTPIIVGGTGLYIKSLIDGIETSEIKPNLKLRNKLENLSLKDLQEKLNKLNKNVWEEMNESDRGNRRRIIRKIEILTNGKWQMVNGKKSEGEFLQIGLELPREDLKKNIDARVDERIKDGAINEAKTLYKDYSNLNQQVRDANGYRQLFEYLKGIVTYEKAIDGWKISEYHHAKNQMTWFKKDQRILWFDAQDADLFGSVERKVNSFLLS